MGEGEEAVATPQSQTDYEELGHCPMNNAEYLECSDHISVQWVHMSGGQMWRANGRTKEVGD